MNFMISILGWFLWNWAELTVKQKQYDEDNDPSTVFTYGGYAKSKINSWIGSLACVPLLLWLGSKQLGLEPLAPLTGHPLSWNDLYYIAAGALWELIIFLVGQIQRIIKKRSQQQ